MKNSIIFSLLIIFIISACSNSERCFVLSGELNNGSDSTQIILFDETTELLNDTTYLIDNKFVIKDRVKSEGKYLLKIDMNKVVNGERDYTKIFITPLYFVNSDMYIKISIDSLNNITTIMEGSKLHEIYSEYLSKVKFENDSLSALRNRMMNEYYFAKYYNKEVEMASIFKLIDSEQSMKNSYFNKTLNFAKLNSSSVVSFDLLQNLLDGTDLSVEEINAIEEVLAGMNLTDSSQLSIVKSKVKKAYATARGSYLKNFMVASANGDTLMIKNILPSDKKYILVEFWASWCSPCRAEIPHLKEVYNNFKKSGFDIISISIDDNTNSWKEALSVEKLTWKQFINPTGSKGNGLDSLNITGVPACILVDKGGKIISTNMRGPYLDAFLEKSK